jgi:hypothetical protein
MTGEWTPEQFVDVRRRSRVQRNNSRRIREIARRQRVQAMLALMTARERVAAAVEPDEPR